MTVFSRWLPTVWDFGNGDTLGRAPWGFLIVALVLDNGGRGEV